ncbi:hypothetical protein BAY61_32020 (plasmid) [Prauserella marina]|uniref:Uncharacterized protein n=1 Tax=Prauserella marina TaxID=530584 RepID=A0A222W1I0_9PSEU|nr:hypothetical protein [Prauserella marina]ASR39912.1 hypothetical protein BAY61_32020 [Prauserella marina]PWV71411.1 hypothetical protein DES30_112127 [Prauserella marina]SDD98262.1 hypothetical protein SAMN05421630_115152 [Prauserella marina]
MSDSMAPLGEALRKLERTTVSVSANMDRLLGHFDIPGVTEEEIDRVLAAEAGRAPRRDR